MEESIEEKPASGFDEFPITATTKEALRAASFEAPTDVQRAAFEPIRSGRDIVIQARTGTGKTAAVGVPLMDGLSSAAAELVFLVLTPTRELALQFATELERIGAKSEVKVGIAYGGIPVEPQMAAIRGGIHGIVGTPGRMLDLLDRMPSMASKLRVLVLDEVDEMLSMGFERDVEAIIQRFPGRYQGIFLSATLPPQILRMADRFLREPAVLSLSDDAISPHEIRHLFFMIDPANRLRDLVAILEAERPQTSFIFSNTRDDAQVAAAHLQRLGFDVELLSGELSQAERERVMALVREGKVAHLVATDVAARGIDVMHLTHIVNYQFPTSLEQYVHRSGRVGRLGQTGTAISLIGPQDLGNLYYLRLTYGIRPIERALPSDADLRREREAEFVRVLAERHGGKPPGASFVALLRRLRTCSAGDDILAGVLEAQLHGVDPRAEARAGEIEKRKAAVAAAEAAAGRRPSSIGRVRAPGSRPAEPDAAPGAAQAVGDAQGRRGERPRRPGARRDSIPPRGPEAGPAAARPDDDAPAARAAPPAGHREIYLNVGDRDGVEGDFIAQWLQSRLGVRSADLGPIRVRDRSTFLSVPADRIGDAIAALTGLRFGGRDVVAEEARRK